MMELKESTAVSWRPFTQMKTAQLPLNIKRAKGCYLYTDQDKEIFDAISSWWVNLHGHCHDKIVLAVSNQMSRLDHVLFAGMNHDQAQILSQRLVEIAPTDLSRVFYSDDGSTAVEVALKMALQYWHNQGTPKHRFIAFKGAYHGDTFGAMAVSDRNIFNRPFWDHLFQVDFISPPVPGGEKESYRELETLLKNHNDIAGFIFEPLVQGTAGMKMQSLEGMRDLIGLAKKYNVVTIADEVMTGLGRTGAIWALNTLETTADILCLAKGITGGTMTLGVTLACDKIFEQFLSEQKEKAFFHGHSYMANPVACAASNASLELLLSDECTKQRKEIEDCHKDFQNSILKETKFQNVVRDLRVQGTIMALEFNIGEQSGYFHSKRDYLYNYSIEKGVLLRPLGNVLYLIPPYCSMKRDLNKAYTVLEELLEELSSTIGG